MDNFHNQLYTYRFNEDYEKLYESLLVNPGDFRVLWLPTTNTMRFMEFSNPQWSATHPLRFYSGKPSFSIVDSFNDPGFFVRWISTGFYQEKNMHLGKLLGLANVKYVIRQYNVEGRGSPVILSNETLSLVLKNQVALQEFTNTSSYQLLYNIDALSHLYPTLETMLTGGGRSVLTSMSYGDQRFNESAFLFTNQMSHDNIDQLTSFIDTIIIPEGQLFDFISSVMPDDYVYEPGVNAAFSPGLPWTKWVNLQGWFFDYSINSGGQAGEYLGALENAAFTSANDTLLIPFSTSKADTYYVWVKLFHGIEGSNVGLAIDESELRVISTRSPNNRGFLWRQLSGTFLSKGAHLLGVRNDGKGQNAVAKIIIAPLDIVKEAFKAITKLFETKKIVLIYEFERQGLEPHASWHVSNEFGVDASHGEVLKSVSDASFMELPFFIPKNGTYELYIRARGQPNHSNTMTINLNGRNTSLSLSNTALQWHEIFRLPLEKGEHTLGITASDKVSLDQLLVKSLAVAGRSSTKILYQKINPTKYLVHVESEKPFLLVFSESYDPHWRASVGDFELSSYKTNSFVNGFYINKTGKFDILIEYQLQKYWEIGLVLSAVTGVFVIMILIISIRSERATRAQNYKKLALSDLELITDE